MNQAPIPKFVNEHKNELILYGMMCRAIAECHAIDEVKEIRDRALALEVYAAQALNTEAERQAIEIRLRAERRAGQMLAEMKQKGERRTKGRGKEMSSATTLPDLGISRDQSSQWQRLAQVPNEQFESALTDRSSMPSREKILASAQPKSSANDLKPGEKPVDARSLWVWGRILDFEQDGIIAEQPSTISEGMIAGMRSDIRPIIPKLIRWLQGFQVELTEGLTSKPAAKGPTVIDVETRVLS